MKDEDNIKVFLDLEVEDFEMEESTENREVQSFRKKKISLLHSFP